MGELRPLNPAEQGGVSSVTPAGVLRPEIFEWNAYHVADSTGLVKLDAMENPYVLPESIQTELARVLGAAPLNRYPDAAARELVAEMRARLDIPAEAAVLLGNGSDELIQILCQAVARPGAVVLGVEPSFVMYRMSALAAGATYRGVALGEGFALDRGALLQAIDEHRPALIFLAYPNNPTGNLFDDAILTEVVEAAPGLVVIDEAYQAFAGATWMSRLARHRHVLVMRTFSKLGLAGLRLGYLVGAPEWVGELDKLRLPYNINVLSQMAATVALRHLPVLTSQAARLVEERARLIDALGRRSGVHVFPSRTNFVTFRIAQGPAVFMGLKVGGVLIKNLDPAHPSLRDCLRVTVGTPEENARFLAILDAVLHSGVSLDD